MRGRPRASGAVPAGPALRGAVLACDRMRPRPQEPPDPPAERLGLIDPARVAVVVPAWNEAGKIGDVVRKVPRRWAGTVIVVDDHSSDSTSEEARSAGADLVIRHERNRGVGAGIRTGLLEAKRRGLEFAAVLSGDDQHEPDELPRVLVPLFAGEADLVQGSRWLPGGATPGIPPDRRWLTRLYALLFRLASGFPITDGTNGMRAFRLALLTRRASGSSRTGSTATSSSPTCCSRSSTPATVCARRRSRSAIMGAAPPRCACSATAGASSARSSTCASASVTDPSGRTSRMIQIENTRVLVTGGAGFVGANLVRRLLRGGARVTVLDDLFTGRLENLPREGVEFVQGSVCDPGTVEKLVREAEVVFHAAARNIVVSTRNPREDFETNIGGTLNVLMAAKAAGERVRRVVYTSSTSVYGNPRHLPINEDDHLSLLTPYAVSKLGGENYCMAFFESYGVPATAVRYSNVYGPGQDPANPYCGVVAKFIESLFAGRAPVIHGDG